MKLCIVHFSHGCDCPTDVSQADVHVKEIHFDKLPAIAVLQGEPSIRGPLVITWKTTRLPDGSFLSQCIEVRGPTESRYYPA